MEKKKSRRKRKWTFSDHNKGQSFLAYMRKMSTLLPGLEEKDYPIILIDFVMASYQILTPEEVVKFVALYFEKEIKKKNKVNYTEEGKKLLGKDRYSPQKEIFVKQNRMKAKRGKRADLGEIEFRSAMEANVARYLNSIKAKWEYEPKRFVFKKRYKTGGTSYLPDFHFILNGEDHWLEVKGRLLSKDKSRLKRFKDSHPKEAEKLIIITFKRSKDVITLAESLGSEIWYIEEIDKSKIPNWEGR